MKTFIIFLALLSGMCYSCYRLGKWKERRDLTAALVKSIETTYWEGFNDRNKQCVEEYDRIYKDGYNKCLTEDYSIKDRY